MSIDIHVHMYYTKTIKNEAERQGGTTMTKQEARDAIMAATQRAFAAYDAQHGGIVRGMSRPQMHTYADARTEYANSVLPQMIPADVMSLAV